MLVDNHFPIPINESQKDQSQHLTESSYGSIQGRTIDDYTKEIEDLKRNHLIAVRKETGAICGLSAGTLTCMTTVVAEMFLAAFCVSPWICLGAGVTGCGAGTACCISGACLDNNNGVWYPSDKIQEIVNKVLHNSHFTGEMKARVLTDDDYVPDTIDCTKFPLHVNKEDIEQMLQHVNRAPEKVIAHLKDESTMEGIKMLLGKGGQLHLPQTEEMDHDFTLLPKLTNSHTVVFTFGSSIPAKETIDKLVTGLKSIYKAIDTPLYVTLGSDRAIANFDIKRFSPQYKYKSVGDFMYKLIPLRTYDETQT